jgi:hypothetical protein
VVHRHVILGALTAAATLLTACRDDGNDQGIRLQHEQQGNDRSGSGRGYWGFDSLRGG